MKRIADFLWPVLARIAARRAPDFLIGGAENPYLRRWWLIPRNPVFNIYLHHFCRSDDDRALHDHPWWNASLLLSGSYIEWFNAPPGSLHGIAEYDTEGYWTGRYFWPRYRHAGDLVLRGARAAHRIELPRDESGKEMPVWTLFITGPRIREWGFLCPRGWRRWQDFTAPFDSGQIGRGCD